MSAGSFDSKFFTYFSFEEVLIEMIKITTSNTGTNVLATYFYSHDGTVGCVKKQNKPAHEQPCAGARKPSAD
jgi:hypothetical protein